MSGDNNKIRPCLQQLHIIKITGKPHIFAKLSTAGVFGLIEKMQCGYWQEGVQ
jgi:hypothetical protein